MSRDWSKSRSQSRSSLSGDKTSLFSDSDGDENKYKNKYWDDEDDDELFSADRKKKVDKQKQSFVNFEEKPKETHRPLLQSDDDEKKKKKKKKYDEDDEDDYERRRTSSPRARSPPTTKSPRKRSKSPSSSSSSRSSSLDSKISYSSRYSDSSLTGLDDYDSSDDLDLELINSKAYLSLNVIQAILTLRTINKNLKKLRNKHRRLKSALSENQNEQESDLVRKAELDVCTEKIINESIELIPLTQVFYGNVHRRTAYAYGNLAFCYLEYKSMPKQAKYNCEKAWEILFESLKTEIQDETSQMNSASNANDSIDKETVEHSSQVSINSNEGESIDLEEEKMQMILNYTYGRACCVLKENVEGEKALKNAETYFEKWRDSVRLSKSYYQSKLREIRDWKVKIRFALAKQLAINQKINSATEYYDKLVLKLSDKRNMDEKEFEKETEQKQDGSKPLNERDLLLIAVYEDLSKIELLDSRHDRAVDMLNAAIKVAENKQASILVADCKLKLAKLLTNLDDMTSSKSSEMFFKECIDIYTANLNGKHSKVLKAKEELAKYYLTQEKYFDGKNILTELLKDQTEVLGDYNVGLNQTYKLLCSTLLKLNDMPNAAYYLQKSLDLEAVNYGPKDARTIQTKETLSNLKKNPSVQIRLKVPTKETERPTFTVAKKIDYSKKDKELYSKVAAPSAENADKTINSTLNEEKSFYKNINPMK